MARRGQNSAVERIQYNDDIVTALAFWKKGTAAGPRDTSRFLARELRTGRSEDATRGLWSALGIKSEEQQYKIKKDGCKAIKKEFKDHGKTDESGAPNDGFGSDWKRFKYVSSKKAKPYTQENGAKRDSLETHVGLSLADFVAKPAARKVKLTEAHVLALRLYTSNSYPRINEPLRKCTKPHPFAATTFFAAEALRLLRELRVQDGIQRRFFWRGLENMGATKEFFGQGGTEMACMSTTEVEDVARGFAKVGIAKNPLLLKIKTTSCMDCGAELAWISMYPEEKEVLFPPLTFLKPEKIEGQAVGGAPADCTIITVVPQWAA